VIYVNKHLIDFEASLGYYSSEVFSFNNGGFVNKHLIDFEASLGYYSSEVFSFNNGGFTCH